MQSVQSDREREEELRLYLEWKTSKTRRRQEAVLLGLWQACWPTTVAVVKRLAERLSSKKNQHITVPAWLWMHGLTLDEAHAEAFPAVLQAAKRFRPEKGNKFSTYAHDFIYGRIYRTIRRGDALNEARPWSDGLNETLSLDDANDGGADLWDLFELDPHNGGPGKYSDRGALLDSLDANTLRDTRNWLEDNKERAVATYGLGRWLGLRADVGLMALGKQMPPEVRNMDLLANKAKDDLPLQGVAIRMDGKTWDLDLPIRAELLRGEGLSGREIAKRLGKAESSLREIQGRAKELNFSLSNFTTNDLDTIARGRKRGRPPKS